MILCEQTWRWIGGIAATILVLVGVGYGITNMGEDMRPPTPQDTFSDPEAAYKALSISSQSPSKPCIKAVY